MSARPVVSLEPVVPRGFQFAAVRAGIKRNQFDLALAQAEPGTQAAALFTRNRVVAAPIILGRDNLAATRGRIRALLVNSGNANCATGARGLRDCRRVCGAVARLLAVRTNEVVPSSTGVIGVPLPAEKLLLAAPALVAALAATPQALAQFALAIMTTDTRPKIASVPLRVGSATVTVTGVAKGAGMIHPNLATMLVYIFTDAGLGARELRRALTAACADSFNAISVDGDTSTNDTVLLMASGAGPRLASSSTRKAFQSALDAVCSSLAEQIICDGEGVQHVVRLHISEARTRDEAARIANAIATSMLVKTAFAGADPNWGRILAAVGRAGVALDPARVSIAFGKQQVCRRGAAVDFDEAQAHAYLSQPSYDVSVSLGRGRAHHTLLTCDLTADYVRINADYRS